MNFLFPSDRKKGFSSLEFIVLSLIIAILLAISSSFLLKWIHYSQVKLLAEELVSNLNWARALALKHGSSCVSFDIANNTYAIFAPQTDSSPKRKVFLATNININPSLALGGQTINFKMNSLPDRNGSVYISGYGKQYRIVINLNGQIRLE